MKLKAKILIVLIFNSILLFGQKIDYSEDWLADFYNDTTLLDDLRFKGLVCSVDISNELKYIILNNSDSTYAWQDNGIFGEDNHRINFVFLSVYKDLKNPLIYHIIGKDRLKGNITDFEGYILINKIRKYNYESVRIFGNQLSDTLLLGRFVADYEFRENEKQGGSGIFKGVFSANIDITPNYLNYASLSGEFETAKYHGSFVGTWQDYKTKKIKKCIWTIGSTAFPCPGDFWIPMTKAEIAEEHRKQKCKCEIDSEHLKINPKYLENGWTNYWPDNERWWINKK